MSSSNPEFQFYTPTRLLFGQGKVRGAGKELVALGCKRPLVVTDAFLAKSELISALLESLESHGCTPVVFGEVEPNPSAPTVHRGLEFIRSAGCDSVIAFGGGSPIDAAKAMAMLFANEGSILDYEIGKKPILNKGLPLMTIPTTSGTGSELTFWSVITDPATHRKFDVGTPLMAAAVAIDDPNLTANLPPAMTAATGMDALTHAIEALTTKGAHPVSSTLALKAIELIGENLPRVMNDPCDREGRSAMMLGSAMAGMAFPNAGLGAVHGLTAPMSGHLGAAHGQANAALLPFVMEYNLVACVAQYAAIARLWGYEGKEDEQAARFTIRKILWMNETFGIPTLAQMGVNGDNISVLARDSFGEFSNNNSNPVSLDQAAAEDIFKRAAGC